VPTSTSSAIEASITSTSTNTSVLNAGCSCGYVLKGHDDAYYPLAIVVDFTQISSIEQFASLGLKISTGRIGGVNRDDGVTLCRSEASNCRFTSEGMEMVVPGKSSSIPAARLWSIEADHRFVSLQADNLLAARSRVPDYRAATR
jgi:hypothetical protein